MEIRISRKILVIGVLFLLLGASAVFSASALRTTERTPGSIQKIIPAIDNKFVASVSLVDNILISNNAQGNDYKPIVATASSDNRIFLVYEQEIDIFTKNMPIVYSTDKGRTWSLSLTVDETVLPGGGSGVLENPHIIYNNANDQFFFVAIDPYTDQYQQIKGFVRSNGSVDLNQYGWGTENNVYTVALCSDNQFCMAAIGDHASAAESLINDWTLSNWSDPPGCPANSYFMDGQSMWPTGPCMELEGTVNDNRMILVFEGTNPTFGTHRIGTKSFTCNEVALNSGEQQNGMYKYRDIEQAPGEWLAIDGTDPDAWGSVDKVCVVYVTSGGDVLCSRSTCSIDYEPQYSWSTSSVETGASTPAVWMSGTSVVCAYVKGGNLFIKRSTDGGATWGAAEQMNAVDGTVMSTSGSVDISKGVVVFQDNRAGKSQIYCELFVTDEPNAPTITGPASGDAKKPYPYNFVTIDPQSDQVTYIINWGDGTPEETAGPAASGTPVQVSHTFAAKGEYPIKAKAKDTGGHESDWGTLTVSMPYEIRSPFQLLLEKLFERFPHAFPILRQLLGY